MAAGVEFHTGVPDTLAFACRLVRKAYRRGFTVLCLAPRADLDKLDRALWTFVEREFIPHARLGVATAAMLERSPIWLATEMPGEGTSRDVVVRLGAETALGQAASARTIEVVGQDADEVDRGRDLWRQYKAAGFEVVHHPFAALRED